MAYQKKATTTSATTKSKAEDTKVEKDTVKETVAEVKKPKKLCIVFKVMLYVILLKCLWKLDNLSTLKCTNSTSVINIVLCSFRNPLNIFKIPSGRWRLE